MHATNLLVNLVVKQKLQNTFSQMDAKFQFFLQTLKKNIILHFFLVAKKIFQSINYCRNSTVYIQNKIAIVHIIIINTSI